jgi:hypothetical protein
LAEDTEGDFSSLAYYPRLWALLGEPEKTTPLPSFDRMWELWLDLETWSKSDKQEELGRFDFRIRGTFDHVGLPWSQTLLSFDERKQLHLIFYEAEFDPTNLPPQETMRTVIARYGARDHRLSARTIRVLTGEPSEFQQTLLELITEELSAWDGTVPEVLAAEREQTIARSGLRICINVDEVSINIRSYFRFKSNLPLPDNGLHFALTESIILSCEQSSVRDWSTPLKADGRIFEASSLDWMSGIRLIDVEAKWEACLARKPLRLFVVGRTEKLPDWIEVQRLERGKEFWILAPSKLASTLLEWGPGACDAFYQMGFSGIPAGWTAFFCKNPKESCREIDTLRLSNLLRLTFSGGIRIGSGTIFLKKSLPDILLENASGNEKVFVNGRPIPRCGDVPLWRLPESMGQNVLSIVVKENHTILLRRSLRVKDPEVPSQFNLVIKRDRYGRRTENQPCVVGSVVQNIASEHSEFPLLLPTHLARRLLFLGCRPGQIIEWPHEEVPNDWSPVWAIVRISRSRRDVHFCGNVEEIETRCQPGEPVQDPALTRKWKEVIWYNQKLTKEPSLRELKELWRKYIESAKNV